MKQDHETAPDHRLIPSVVDTPTALVPHTPEAGWCFPEVGIAIGLGLGFVESALFLHPMLDQIGGDGILSLYLPMLVTYALVGGAVDLLVQGAWLVRGLDAPGWVLGGGVLGNLSYCRGGA